MLPVKLVLVPGLVLVVMDYIVQVKACLVVDNREQLQE
jgi:hypothetical protein